MARFIKRAGKTGQVTDIVDAILNNRVFVTPMTLSELLADGYDGNKPTVTAGGVFVAQCADGQYQISVGADGRSLASASGAEAGAQLETALRQPIKISKVVFFGASITNSIASGHLAWFQAYMAQRGLTISFVDYTQRGRRLDEARSDWETDKATYRGESETLVYLHHLGNYVTDNRPWGGMTEGDQDQLKADYEALCDSIVENGNQLMIANTTFRNYDGTTADNEENGSKPFNENILYPLMKKYGLSWVGGAPVVNLYDIGKKWLYGVLKTDNVHYNVAGYGVLRRYIAESLYRLIVGLPPVKTADYVNDLSVQRTVISFNNKYAGLTDESNEAESCMGLTCINVVTAVSGIHTVNPLGLTPSGVKVTHYLDDSAVKFRVTDDFTVTDAGLGVYSEEAMEGALYTQSETFIPICKISGLAAGQNATLIIGSYRLTTGTDATRRGEFTADGGATVVALDGSTYDQENSGAAGVGTLDVTADAQGEVTLSGRVTTAGNFLYLNAIDVLPK